MTTSPRWRVALASAASAAVLVAVPLAGAQTAHAQPPSPACQAYPPVPPQLTLSRTVVTAGDTLTFSGTCFAAFEQVVAELHSHEVVLGSFRANAHGVVTGTVTIPRRTEPGYHTFELEGRRSRLELSARVKVLRARHEQDRGGSGEHGMSDGSNGSGRAGGQGAPGPRDLGGEVNTPHGSALAVTGSEQALAVGGLASALVAAGGGTMLAVRRRRRS